MPESSEELTDLARQVHALEVRLSVAEREMKLKFKAANTALELKEKELSRRLELLNGEAGKLHIMQATYWPREVAEPAIVRVRERAEAIGAELRSWCEAKFNGVADELGGLKEFRGNMIGRQAIIAVVTSVIVTLIASWVFKK